MKLRFPGGKQRALTLSYDDGTHQDVRLIGIQPLAITTTQDYLN